VPAANAILAGLSDIANDAVGVGIVWHVVVGVCIVALAAGFRPQPRAAAFALSVPLASVSALAWLYGNPFNGAVFALLAVLLAVLARTGADNYPPHAAPWAFALGTNLVAFAWIYPHFSRDSSLWTYLYRAPLGTIPCPTLALTCGAALIGGGLGPRSWQLVLASAAAFYAIFGVVRLGVSIDVFLLVGAIGLFAQSKAAARPHSQRSTI
jgi:hypothetical protein